MSAKVYFSREITPEKVLELYKLAGKTLGVVGLGAIGKRLAVRAKAFEMDVVAYDPYFDEKFAAENGIAKMELDELLKGADVVSLHVPMTPENYHLISTERLATMKPNASVSSALILE